jgi:hypothetical protein
MIFLFYFFEFQYLSNAVEDIETRRKKRHEELTSELEASMMMINRDQMLLGNLFLEIALRKMI